MKKYIGIFLAVLLCIGIVFAAKPDAKAVKLPAHAVKVGPNVYLLGKAVHKGKIVEGYAIVHYKKGHGKPTGNCGNGICDPGENARKCPEDCGGPAGDSDCYAFMAKGAKWKSVEPYVVNPANNRGLNESYVVANFAADVEKWETAAGKNILGEGSATSALLEVDTETPDGLNEVYFGSIDEPGVIGVTIVWGYFSGAPRFRELIEWDHVYDEVDFDWSASGEAAKMDFESIATHELGHSVGMADLYTGECSEQTMYGYASEGEIKKRTLEAGDIAGVKALYK
ncbi:matrixin family metalloprotease [Candidatus Woesearchaeota archaeon]|nr:matrixin family metalloprotease [Candidatus Woesearchaeota archaeon]